MLHEGVGGKLGYAVIPGRCVSIEPGISRFRVWSGACHRAALCADPVGPSRNDSLRWKEHLLRSVSAYVGWFAATRTAGA